MSYWHLLRCALASLANLSQESLSYARSLPGHRRVSFEPLEERRLLSLTLHVDRDASDGGDGLAWETAYSDLQAAFSETALRNTDGDGTNDVDSIWIAEGTYKPSALLNGDDDRSATFSLLDGVDLYGGFAGSEVTVGERDRSAHVTTLSGDIGVADDTADNAYSVVHCDAGVIATLDGISITGGMADGSSDFASVPENSGGGIYSAGNLTVANTTVSDNTTVGYFGNGGGIYNLGTLTVTESALVDNVAGWAGGGICSVGTLVVSDSTMSGNLATSGGGLSGSGAITVTNSTFAHNWGGLGGGIENGGTLSVTNTTIAENAAGLGGGIYCGGPLATETLSNTIVARNEASSGPDIYQSADTLSGSHNLIGSGADHTGLIHGEDGNQVGTAESPIDPGLSGWLEYAAEPSRFLLLHGSPAIDAGANGLAVDADGQPLVEDILGNPRIHDGTVDIGAVESAIMDRSAQTYTVESLENVIADDGVLTFVEAFHGAVTNQPIGDAVGGSPREEDTIRFAGGLTGTALVDRGDLTIADALTIEGPGTDLLNLDGGGVNRVFTVRSGVSASLSGMTITGGAGDIGGAIFNSGTLTVEELVFSNNTAEMGGAIGNEGSLDIVNAAVSGNSGNLHGGAVFNSGVLTVTDSVLSSNSVETGGAAGALYNEGTVTITNATLANNFGGLQGGAVVNSGELTVGNSVLSSNSVEADGGAGAVYSQGTLTISGSTLVENSGGFQGGAVFSSGVLTVTDSVLSSNLIEGGGSAGAVYSEGTLTISKSTLTDNSGGLQGGAVFNSGIATITDSELSGNAAESGGALANEGTLDLLGGRVSGNSSIGAGGGIHSDGTVTISNSTLTDNSAGLEGGGVFSSRALTITSSTFSANTAGHGGAVANQGWGNVIGSALSGNSSTTGGGGIYNRGTLAVSSTSLADNSGGLDGGAILNSGGTLTITGSSLTGNDAAEHGGGISNGGTSKATIANSMFAGNVQTDLEGQSDWGGGAIFSYGELSIANSTIAGNSAFSGGGVLSRGALTLNNSIAALNSGGGIEGDFDGVRSLVNIDPEFVRAPTSGPDNQWGTADDDLGNLRLTGTSPAINSGSNGLALDPAGNPLTIDLAGNPRVTDGTVDLGAYEYQGTPTPGRESPLLIVSSTNDEFDFYDGEITLREALYYSGLDGSGDTISFAPELDQATLTLAAGELHIPHDVAIDASGLSRLTVDGAGLDRVFLTSAEVGLTGLTVTGGSAARGGAIYNTGALTIADVELSGNMAATEGGAIYNTGTLSVRDTTLSDNTAAMGGAISSDGVVTIAGSTFMENKADTAGGAIGGAATVTIMNSTFAENWAGSPTGSSPGRGGAVYAYGTWNIANSTFAGNKAFSGVADPNAVSRGGAIYSGGAVAIANATLVSNSAGAAGGGISGGSMTVLHNTIAAGNDGGISPDVSGWLSGTHNLIGDGSGMSGLDDGSDGNQVGTDALPIDPMLDEWTQFSNGLWGYPLLFGSPAVDAGCNSHLPQDALDVDRDGNTLEVLPIDLAGNSRVRLRTVDIGAYEQVVSRFVVAGHYPQDGFLPVATDSMTISFNRELTTLNVDDLTLTGPDGAVPIVSVSRTGHADDWSEYTVHFDSVTRAGEYQLTVLHTVRDEDGGFLDQDRDGRPGETVDDRYAVSWKLVGPMVDVYAPSGVLPLSTPLTHFDIEFSRPMDQGSFSLDDVTELVGPTGPVQPTSYAWLDETTVRVNFAPVTAMGAVSIGLGTEIRDQWGNGLDQNQNSVVGELDDTWSGSVVRSSAGTVDQDVVIPSSVDELLIDGTLTIAAGATLTIEAGVTLKFGSGGSMVIRGRLITLGEVDQPVVFTSSAASPGSSAWAGIRVLSGGSIDLDHTEVRHAAKAVDANSSGARAVLKNTTLRDGGFGVYVYSPYAEVTAENCLIADNANTGIFVRADSRHSFKNCTIVGNGLGGSAWHGAGIHLGGSILTLENCIVAFNGTGLDHSGDPPTATIRSSLFYNPGGQEIAWDGDPGMPDLAANGNVTADPMFVDRSGGNYELASQSPAIDAGTGVQAPIADRLGRLRYDDRGMPNVGHGFPAYVDMGALERQVDSPLADLAVTHVSDPTPEVVTVGDTVGLEWTVRNVGAVDTTGTWQDRIYLSSDPFLDAGDLLLAAVAHSDPLVPGSDYTEYLTLTIPSTSGPKYVLVHTQFVGGSFHEAVETNNLGVSAVVLAVDVPLLELGVPSQGATTMRQWHYHRFEAEAGRTVLFRLDSQAGVSFLGLRRTLPPTFSHFDELGSASQLDVSVRLLEPVDVTYYVGVYGNMLPGGGTPYTLYADLTTLDIHDVTPNEISNTGTATIRIVGDNFHPDAEVQLIDPDGAPIEGQEYYEDSTRLFTTFNLAAANGLPGLYDVVVTNPGPESVTLADAVKVVRQHESSFMARLSVPAVARPGRVIECRIEYTNSGKVDIPAPILTLDSGIQGTAWRLPSCGDWVEGPDFHLMGLSSEGLPTILRPGQTETLIVQMRVPFGRVSVSVCLSSVGALPTDGSQIAINWEEFETDVRPAGMDHATWADLLAQLQTEIGDTWGDYASMLREDVEHWHEQGQTIHCVRELFGMPDPDPEGLKQDNAHISIRTSYTPEDKFGPAGYDAPGTAEGSEARYIPADQTLGYRVEFWNKPDAEVPTQDAIVMDYIDPAVFDVSTLEITRVGFLGWDLPVSSGQVVDTRIDCMPEMNIAVEVRAGLAMNVPGFANNGELDENTLVFWFHTIDPETGEWPEDPMAGFLPPFNRETGFEIGWVEYTVDPAAGLASGTQLANVAYVEFDFAGDIYDHPAPKVDPSVEPAVADPWINTIDVDGPTSQVETLPATTENEVLTILWAGQDDVGGSGIGGYDIYVSTDDGPFELWLNDTIDTEALFTGSRGSRYAFYSIATDNVGHQEDASQAADATITLVFPLQVDAGPDQAAVEGDLVDLAGSNFTYDGDLANLVLTINWGDGTEEPGTLVPSVGGGTISDSHCYADNGEYIVTLSFSQSGAASVEDRLTVTVSNAVPVANAGGPYSAMENSPIAFVGSATDAGTLDTLTYEWDLDYDGVAFVPEVVGQSVTHTWPDDHTGNVALRVTDNDGASHMAVASLNVTNADPIADAGGPFTVVEGGAVQLDGSGTIDPGSDVLTYEWDLDGDGEYDDATGVRPQFSAAGLDGSVVVTVGLRVSDDDGGIDTAGVDVNITRPEPIRLGAVDFAQLSAVSLADGNAWYELTAVRSGQLTAIASTASGSTTATLYDSSKTLLTVSTAMNGAERLDHSVQAGETYFVRIAGDSTDAELTLANLVNAVGTEVQVFGTDGVDAFEFASTSSYVVTINGVEYDFNETEYETFVFDGSEGNDTATLTGGPGVEVARFFPDHGTFGENGFLVSLSGVKAIAAHGGGGADLAFLYDSPGDDEFISRKGYGKLSGDGFLLEAFDFMTNYGYATTTDGGSDVAFMEDSSTADKFKFDWPKPGQFFGKMYGGGDYYNRAKNFEQIVATMTDGKDTVRLFDSEGDDTFYGRKEQSRMVGPGYDVTVSGYNSLAAYASTGMDLAQLEDSEDDDTTRARPHKITLWGGDDADPTYEIMARRFDEYHFEGKHGGFDRAKLHDTVLADHVHAAGNSASLYTNDSEQDLLYQVAAFEWVKLYATDNGSQDTLDKEGALDFDLVYDKAMWDELP
jgi:parallel beta helix pectate lyase-like protein/PKD domain-containing protein